MKRARTSGPRNSACRSRGDIYNGVRPFRIQGQIHGSRNHFGLAAAGAVHPGRLRLHPGRHQPDARPRRRRTRAGAPTSPPARSRTIGVNAYLWRAALDTLSFAPLAQADSNGGVIVTEWYTNPQNPTERVKVTSTILDRDLRADALRVAASRQTLQNGQWVDAPVTAATVQRLEDIILTRARDLRRAAIAG